MSLKDYDIKKLRNRDPEIFETLYNDYKIIIYNYLLVKTKGNIEVSKDVLSDTFCSIFDSANKIKNISNIKGWLIQIANRRLYDYLRKEYHDKKYTQYFEVNEDIDNDLTDELHKKQQLLLVNIAIDSLKQIYKDVIRLKYMEKKTQKEIAKIINKSESSVESLLIRAKKALKNELKQIKGFVNEF